MEYNRGAMKLEVKAAMKATRPRPMLVTLLFSVILGVGNSVLSGLVNLTGNTGTQLMGQIFEKVMQTGDVEGAIRSTVLMVLLSPSLLAVIITTTTVLGILTYLWSSMMNVSYEGYCLSMVRGENPPLERVFCAFPRAGWVLLTRALVGVFSFLWSMLFSLVLVAGVIVSVYTLRTDMIGVGVLLYIVGYAVFLAGVIWVSLRYAMVDFLLLDAGLTGLDAIRESKRLMKGNKGRLFVLELSFIGWYALQSVILSVVVSTTVAMVFTALLVEDMSGAVIAFMIELLIIAVALIVLYVLGLWLQPYVVGSQAKFYDWLRGSRPEALPGGGGGSYTTYTDGQSSDPWDNGR